MSEWVRKQGVVTMLRLFRHIIKLMRAGVLTTNEGPAFPLDDIQHAAREAEIPGRQGKVLLRIGHR